jgi:hypothetical protein
LAVSPVARHYNDQNIHAHEKNPTVDIKVLEVGRTYPTCPQTTIIKIAERLDKGCTIVWK